MASLARGGVTGTSLRSVCRDMGVAPSLLRHSFAGWQEVLIATFTTVAEHHAAAVRSIIFQNYLSEEQRMEALVKCYLDADWMGDSTTSIMLAFWQLSHTIPALGDLFTQFQADRHSALRRACAAMAQQLQVDLDIDDATTWLILMMDGVWLHLSLNPDVATREYLRALCRTWVMERLTETHESDNPPCPVTRPWHMH